MLVSGIGAAARAHLAAALRKQLGAPLVVLCPEDSAAETFARDLEALLDRPVITLFSREWQLRPGAVASRDWERGRLAALYALTGDEPPAAVVAAADALMARTLPPETLKKLSLTLRAGGRMDLKELTDRLLAAG